MECGEIRKNLNAYLEGLSSPDEKSAVEKHLATCRKCSAELEDLKMTIHLTGTLDEVEPPVWLTQKVMTRVKAETAEATEKESFLARFFHWNRPGIPAAAVAMLVVAVTAVVLIKSMELEIKEAMPPSVPPSMEQQALPPTRKSLPQPTEPEAKPGAKKESSTESKAAGGSAHSDEEKSLAVSPRKKKDLRDIPREDRAADDGEKKNIVGSMESGATSPAPAAPAAPAASSAQRPAAKKPAMALPQSGVTKDEAVFQNAPLRAERRRYAGKAMEEKAAGSVMQPYPYKQVVTERHTNGKPHVVVTYGITAGGPDRKIMEERFDETGRRHGLHMAYDDSGKLKVEVLYEHGRISSAKEYNADGTLRPVESDQNWPWLQINP